MVYAGAPSHTHHIYMWGCAATPISNYFRDYCTGTFRWIAQDGVLLGQKVHPADRSIQVDIVCVPVMYRACQPESVRFISAQCFGLRLHWFRASVGL
jgi:hypothetical protein